jgi:hypothetical protein
MLFVTIFLLVAKPAMFDQKDQKVALGNREFAGELTCCVFVL